jgi:Condensation domain
MSTYRPLTHQQQWLWDLLERHPSWKCTAACAFLIRGPLDIGLLRRSFTQAIRRHDSLRVRITATNATTLQEIQDPYPYHLNILEIGGTSPAEIEANARHQVERLCDARMEPNSECLWHAQLLRLDEHEHWLVLTMHRLIGDCASVDQTYLEIRAQYESELQGRETSLSEPAQYGDYATWQQQTNEEWLRRHEPYWQRSLSEMRPLRWPIDPDCGTIPCNSIGKMTCHFGEALSTEFHALARRSRTLAATLMIAIYVAVLWRWCQQSDFALPFNIAGRHTGHKATIGYFSYILLLRVRLSAQESFRDFLSRLSAEFFSALSHQDFGRVAAKHPDLLAGTLFQWVTWHPDDVKQRAEAPNTRKPAIERVPVRDFGEGLTIVPPGMTAIELTLFDTTEGLHALGTYRADRFATTSMDRFAADLRLATELFVYHPDASLERLLEIRSSEGLTS